MLAHLLLLLSVSLVPATVAESEEKLLAVLDREDIKIVHHKNGNIDATIFVEEAVLELKLEPTFRHTNVKIHDGHGNEDYLHSWEHFGINGLFGVTRLRERGLVVADGSAQIIYDKVKDTISGNFKVGKRQFFMRDDATANKMVFGEKIHFSKIGGLKHKKSEKRPLHDSNFVDFDKEKEADSYRKIYGTSPISDGAECKMKVIVDNKLFRYLQNDMRYATKFAMGMVEGANEIYKDNGPLLSGGSGSQQWPIRFHLQEVSIVTDDSCRSINWNNYLCQIQSNASELLLNFAISEDFSGYCLGFLFTGWDLGETLGLTFVSGACCSSGQLANIPFSYNTGLVAVHNSTFKVPEYVLAHELGHALGSHDDVEPFNQHLMDPQLPHNVTKSVEIFSNESIRSIENLLLKNMFGVPDNDTSNCTCLERNWCFAGIEKEPTDVKTISSADVAFQPSTICAIVVVVVAVFIFFLHNKTSTRPGNVIAKATPNHHHTTNIPQARIIKMSNILIKNDK